MHQLEFDRVHDYSSGDESITLPVDLRSGSNHVPVMASVDTGAAFCVFGAEVAEALGLDLLSVFASVSERRTAGLRPMGTKSKSRPWAL